MKSGIQISFLALVLATASFAQREDTMQEVLKIAHGISAVQPNLADAEYVSYAIGIHRAAKRYGVHPSVLISITQQESGFRPNLPEGPAGEIGICQIIKSWLKNPKFIQHFGHMTPNDLKKPATSFRVAAWILSSLKDSSLSGPLPFWSFYNSREFKNRFKYFLKVSKNLHTLRKHAPNVYSDAVLLAASEPNQEIPTKIQPRAREVATDRPNRDAVKAARMLYPKRMSHRAKASNRLIQTASLGGGSFLAD
jgi:hypothetical protein